MCLKINPKQEKKKKETPPKGCLLENPQPPLQIGLLTFFIWEPRPKWVAVFEDPAGVIVIDNPYIWKILCTRNFLGLYR